MEPAHIDSQYTHTCTVKADRLYAMRINSPTTPTFESIGIYSHEQTKTHRYTLNTTGPHLALEMLPREMTRWRFPLHTYTHTGTLAHTHIQTLSIHHVWRWQTIRRQFNLHQTVKYHSCLEHITIHTHLHRSQRERVFVRSGANRTGGVGGTATVHHRHAAHNSTSKR